MVRCTLCTALLLSACWLASNSISNAGHGAAYVAMRGTTSQAQTRGTEFDIVVLGATGFTGRIACEHLANRAPKDLRWAMAGRNEEKLARVRRDLNLDPKEVPIIFARADKDAEMHALAGRSRVIANFAGTPFGDKALPVVAACAEKGTCYIDITAEVPFMRTSAERYNDKAQETGALIVHACGYDSIPYDLGAMLAAKEMAKRHGVKCTKIRGFASNSSGSFSGGTINTILDLLNDDDPAFWDPYALDPNGRQGPDEDDFGGVGLWPQQEKVGSLSTWAVPGAMAMANARVVRRSNALSGYSYGEKMSYGELTAVPGFAPGLIVAGVFSLAVAAGSSRSLREGLRRVLPQPGDGPSRESRARGYFETYTVAEGESKAGEQPPMVVARVSSGSAGDPGYNATALMAMESALCCALDRHKCLPTGGVVTPAWGLGMALVDRLNASGMQLSVDPEIEVA